MTEHTNHGLSDDVLERAAEAMYLADAVVIASGNGYWDDLEPEGQELWQDQVRAALPVLVPEVERRLLERMIADAVKARSTVETPGLTYLEAYESSLADWLRTYLPEVTPNGR